MAAHDKSDPQLTQLKCQLAAYLLEINLNLPGSLKPRIVHFAISQQPGVLLTNFGEIKEG